MAVIVNCNLFFLGGGEIRASYEPYNHICENYIISNRVHTVYHILEQLHNLSGTFIGDVPARMCFSFIISESRLKCKKTENVLILVKQFRGELFNFVFWNSCALEDKSYLKLFYVIPWWLAGDKGTSALRVAVYRTEAGKLFKPCCGAVRFAHLHGSVAVIQK